MKKIMSYGLFLLSRTWDNKYWFLYPQDFFSTLSGAKNAKILKKIDCYNSVNDIFVIVPYTCPFDKNCSVKYMFNNGEWVTDIDSDVFSAFERLHNCK